MLVHITSTILTTLPVVLLPKTKKWSVRERFKLIKEKSKCKIREEENSSGTDVEPTSELEQALEEICSFEESFLVEEKESKQAKEE